MEPAARIGLDLLLTTIVVPMATVVVVAAVGLRLGRPLGGLALVAGALTGAAAVVGWPLPPEEAHHWIPLGACGAALGGLAVDRLASGSEGRPRFGWIGAVGLVALSVTAWCVLGPLAGLWTDGVLGPLARDAWVVEPLAVGLLAWLAVDHAARHGHPPAALAALVLGLTAAALVLALGGTARMGQLLGATAAATGATLLCLWRWPRLGLGHSGVAAPALTLVLVVLYGHHYAEVPRPGAALTLLVPFAALAAVGVASPLRSVGLVLLLAAPAAGSAVYLATQADAPSSQDEADADAYDASIRARRGDLFFTGPKFL